MPDVPTTTDPLVIPVPGEPGTPTEGEKKMAATVDATIELVLQQAFAKSHQVGLQAADRHSAGNDNLGELTRHTFLAEVTKVGTREASAMQRMDDNKLAQNILAQRAASVQPPIAGNLKPPGT